MDESGNTDHISSSTSHYIISPDKGHNEIDNEPNDYTHDSTTSITLIIMLLYLIRHHHQHADTYSSSNSSISTSRSTTIIIIKDDNSDYDDKHSVSE